MSKSKHNSELFIMLSEEEVRMLKQYALLYDTERKLDGTNDPIVLIQNKVKHYTSGDYHNDGKDYEVMIDTYNYTEDGLVDINELREILAENLIDFEEDQNKVTEILDDIFDDLTGFYSKDEIEITEPVCVKIKAHYYKWDYKTVAYFFTRKEADDYVKYQAHNLHSPRVYTDYAGYGNEGDFPVFQKLLRRMGEMLNANNDL